MFGYGEEAQGGYVKKKTKVRKPTNLKLRYNDLADVSKNGIYLTIDWHAEIWPQEARKLAAWLIKAADWMESRM